MIILLFSTLQSFINQNEFSYHSKTTTSDAQISGTQTLGGYNNVFVTNQNLIADQNIYLNISSTGNITFIMYNKSIDNLALTNIRNIGMLNDSFNITNADSKDIPFFLFKGDSLRINFTLNQGKDMPSKLADSGITFEITNSTGSIVNEYTEQYGLNSILFIPNETQTYHLKWVDNYTFRNSPTGIVPGAIQYQLALKYNISSITVPKISLLTLNTTDFSQNVLTIPKNGTYQLIFYHNQLITNNSVTFSFNAIVRTFSTTIIKEPTIFAPISLAIDLIILLLSIIVIISAIQSLKYKIEENLTNRRLQKQLQARKLQSLDKFHICPRCGNKLDNLDYYCLNCGVKVKNGLYKVPVIEKMNISTNCLKCGCELEENTKFCPKCGERVK